MIHFLSSPSFLKTNLDKKQTNRSNLHFLVKLVMFKVYEMTADLSLLSFGGRCISQVFYPIRLQIICLCIQSADLYLSLQSYISYIVPRHKGMHLHKETCSHIETTVSIGYYVKGCVLTQTTIIFFCHLNLKKFFFSASKSKKQIHDDTKVQHTQDIDGFVFFKATASNPSSILMCTL